MNRPIYGDWAPILLVIDFQTLEVDCQERLVTNLQEGGPARTHRCLRRHNAGREAPAVP